MSPTVNKYYNNLLMSNFDENKKLYETPQKNFNIHNDFYWNDPNLFNKDHILYESPLFPRNLSKKSYKLIVYFFLKDSSNFKRIDYNYDSEKIANRNLTFNCLDNNFGSTKTDLISGSIVTHNPISNNFQLQSINIKIDNVIKNNENVNKNKTNGFLTGGNYSKMTESTNNLPKNNNLLIYSDENYTNNQGIDKTKKEKIICVNYKESFSPEIKENNNDLIFNNNKEKDEVFSFESKNEKIRKNKFNLLIEKVPVSKADDDDTKCKEFKSIDKKLDQMKR